VFGDATKVKFSQLNAKERFTALQSGEVDMLSRNTTMTSSRDAGMGLKFPASSLLRRHRLPGEQQAGREAPRSWTARPSASRPVPPPS
jgi:hypothetical protein